MIRPFDLIAVLLTLSAGLSYLNYRFLKLPSTIGLMALTLAGSLLVVAAGQLAPGLRHGGETFISQINFSDAVLHGMLGFLLFAGALHVKLNDLAQWRVPIAVLATVGVLISTLLIGCMTWGAFSALGIEIGFTYCLLFGTLISPTDPIAVLGLLKQFGAPKALEVKIAGESLFNDGVAVAAFLAVLGIATGGSQPEPADLALAFAWEAGGGLAYGLTIGWIAFRLFKSVDNYQVEVLLSLALVAGGYSLAEHIHVSAPIAMVVAGLLVGNQGRSLAMSSTTVERLDDFWELVDEILNAILFVLLGLEAFVLVFTGQLLAAGAAAVFIVLFARLVAVGLPVLAMRKRWPFEVHTIAILTWGGLRGGLSVAMALSVPAEVGGVEVTERNVILAVTYVVVCFSILVQGLTVGKLVNRWLPSERA